jgi:hypothetical protein
MTAAAPRFALISRPWKIGLGLLLFVTGGAVIILVRLDNARLTRQIAARQAAHSQTVRRREDNRQLQELIDRSHLDRAEAARATQAELILVRAEVAELEKHAAETHARLTAQRAADAAALAANRDPEHGLTRLEYFRDVGQATPAAAFQTAIWAALQGQDERLAGLIMLSRAAGDAAAALLASLPEADRARYPTPEKIAALFFADLATARTAAQFTTAFESDPTIATITVTGLSDDPEKVSMQLGPQGWQIKVTPGFAKTLAKWVQAKTAPPGK